MPSQQVSQLIACSPHFPTTIRTNDCISYDPLHPP
uniref:Uncharacterized protein n=1 Tax=Rhizophora mucronata TaxID=61149 RepID=A0A2P2P7G2_RHIMU